MCAGKFLRCCLKNNQYQIHTSTDSFVYMQVWVFSCQKGKRGWCHSSRTAAGVGSSGIQILLLLTVLWNAIKKRIPLRETEAHLHQLHRWQECKTGVGSRLIWGIKTVFTFLKTWEGVAEKHRMLSCDMFIRVRQINLRIGRQSSGAVVSAVASQQGLGWRSAFLCVYALPLAWSLFLVSQYTCLHLMHTYTHA